ncbi:unnamed protein product [Rhizophagus irregularis]|nr:unnamed protein product [Rhizophagus irregularis]
MLMSSKLRYCFSSTGVIYSDEPQLKYIVHTSLSSTRIGLSSLSVSFSSFSADSISDKMLSQFNSSLCHFQDDSSKESSFNSILKPLSF